MNLGIRLSLALLPSLSAPGEGVDAARQYRQEHGARILAEFVELLSIPNVASDMVNLRRNAEYIREALARRGVRAELLKVPGAPACVFGELETLGATRTLGIYAHYDGQPVDRSQWKHPPWKPVLYADAMDAGGRQRAWPKPGETVEPQWRVYARAAGDDKAPIVAILAALDALRKNRIPLTSNLKFFFEGEEEAGSPHLRQYFENHRDRLEVDAWIICDGPWHQSRRAQVVFGVRGITGLEITVYGATRYLHSGHYGNWAPNPGLALARLLASMKDGDGRVLIEGFYDTVQPLGPAERKALADVPAIDEALRRELGLARTEAGNAPYAERLLLPSLNIRGLACGTVGETARNVIPTTATMSIDIRLVPGNEPEAMLDRVEAHIQKQGYHIVRDEPDPTTRRRHPRIAKVIREKGYPATRTSMDLPIIRQVTAAAEKAAGDPPIRLPSLGGSLPLYLFTDVLGRPAVITPIANHDNNQHAPNENIRLGNLFYGIDLAAALFTMPDRD